MTVDQHTYFSDKYEKYADMIYRISLIYLKNIQDAEDLVSDVFIKLMEKKLAFNNDAHEKAWVIRITINSCKNALKSKWFQRVNYEESIYSYLNTKEDIRLMDDIMRLAPKYRTVIYLYYYEGYKMCEISDMLNIKESTIRSQISRGRKMLKSFITEGGCYNV